MKLASNIAGILLGLVFNVVSLNFFFRFFQMPEQPAGSPPEMFLGAMIPTGYFAFVEVRKSSAVFSSPFRARSRSAC